MERGRVALIDLSALEEGLRITDLKEMGYESIIIPSNAIIELYRRSKEEEKARAALQELREISEELQLKVVDIPSDSPQELWQVALEREAEVITADKELSEIYEVMGLKVRLIERKVDESLPFEKWLTPYTTSLHIKAGVNVQRKVGTPGNWKLEVLEDVPSPKEVEEMVVKIERLAELSEDGFLEVNRPGSSIVQLGRYRIVIVKPPVSDNWEITIVIPLVQLHLDYYNLSGKLINRLDWSAEGIVIAGAPGHGKTTFAQALAEHYYLKGRVVKTLESPRDLQVPPGITQYSKSFATSQELHDILLLARPDYVIFDEMRDTEDFELYVDLRLAGVGMVGVVHATTPISAVQRFISRVELGTIPQIIDTVIFIKDGTVEKVLSLELKVKVPTGMRDQGLARPVVEVRDFETGELEYELYTFGEETVIAPVGSIEVEDEEDEAAKVVAELLEDRVKELLKTEKVKAFVRGSRAVLWIPEKYRSKLIGRKGKRIEALEREFSLRIDVKGFE